MVDRQHLRALVWLDSIPRRWVALRPDDYIARSAPKSATAQRTNKKHALLGPIARRYMYHDAPPTTPPMITYLAQGGQQQPPRGPKHEALSSAHIGMACSAHTVSISYRPDALERRYAPRRQTVFHQRFAKGRRHCCRGKCFNLLHTPSGRRGELPQPAIPTGGYGLFRAPPHGARSRRRLERELN